MNTLLIHNADYKTVIEVDSWKEKQSINDGFFHLSFFFDNTDPEVLMNYIRTQIHKLISKKTCDKVVVFTSNQQDISDLVGKLSYSFPSIELQQQSLLIH